MFTLTPAAAAELAQFRESRGIPDTAGIRASAEPADDGQLRVALAFSEVPAEDDQVTEQQGTRLFVAANLVEPLAETALDVAQTPEGPQLLLTPASEAGGMN